MLNYRFVYFDSIIFNSFSVYQQVQQIKTMFFTNFYLDLLFVTFYLKYYCAVYNGCYLGPPEFAVGFSYKFVEV